MPFFRWKGLQILFFVVVMSLITISLRYNHNKSRIENDGIIADEEEKRASPIDVVLVSCGHNRTLFNYSTNFLKTALLFATSTNPIKFTIYADDDNKKFISDTVESWPANITRKHIIEYREPKYPDEYKNWANRFGPCATLRLFLPDLMPNVDSVLYLDNDILVMTDLNNMWKEFDRFGPKQMLGLGQEREDSNEVSYYNNKSIPYIPPYGINSGVIMMNLTRMRDFSFIEKVKLIYNEYKRDIGLFDQDLINILGYYNPDIIYKLDCGYNFLPYHCVPSLNCMSLIKHGPKILHGVAGRFVGGKRLEFREPIYELVFKAIDKYNFTNSMSDLIAEVKESKKTLPQTKCAKYSDLLINPLIDLNLA